MSSRTPPGQDRRPFRVGEDEDEINYHDNRGGSTLVHKVQRDRPRELPFVVDEEPEGEDVFTSAPWVDGEESARSQRRLVYQGGSIRDASGMDAVEMLTGRKAPPKPEEPPSLPQGAVVYVPGKGIVPKGAESKEEPAPLPVPRPIPRGSRPPGPPPVPGASVTPPPPPPPPSVTPSGPPAGAPPLAPRAPAPPSVGALGARLGAARVATPMRAELEGTPFSGEEEATLVGAHPRALGRPGALEEVARLGALFSSPQAPSGFGPAPAPSGLGAAPSAPASFASAVVPAPPVSASVGVAQGPAPSSPRPALSEDSSDKLDLQRLDEALLALDRAASVVTPSQPLAASAVASPPLPPALPTMTPTTAQPAMAAPAVAAPVVVAPAMVAPASPRPAVRHEPASNARTEVAGKPLRLGAVRLVLLDEDGSPREVRVLEESRAILGREDADVLLADDPTVSPWHAQLVLRRSGVFLKDLQSRNGVFVRVAREAALEDGDVILLGRQRLLFRDRWDAARKGEDGTAPAGSEPTAGPARLLLLLAGGDVGALYFVGAGLSLGRDWGDVVFPSDPGLKREHAELRRKNDQHWLRPLDPSAEVFRAIRAEVELQEGDTFMVGRTRLRVSLER